MSRDLFLGIDLGTSGVKCVLQDGSGKSLSNASRTYPTLHRHPDWAEQDPKLWFQATADAVREVVSQYDSSRVLGIGVCGAAHIPVLLDEHMEVIRPAILWTDQRCKEQAASLAANKDLDLLSICFNQASPTWTLPQLMWLQEHEPQAYRRVRHLLLGKDYVIYQLTNQLVTDEGNAGSTLMMDMRCRSWSPALVQISGLPASALPTIVPPHTIVGSLQAAPAKQLGLPVGVPVVAGMLDSVAELLSLGICDDGEAMLRLGTAGGVMAVSREPYPNSGMITYPYLLNQSWCCQAFNNSCATAVTWARDLLGRDEQGAVLTYSNLDKLAATAPAGCDGLIFHPYLLGERVPLWDPHVRASFVGATLNHHRMHFARAVLEGLAFSIRECYDTLLNGGYVIQSIRLTGGGAKSAVWRQILSDVFAMPMSWVGASDSAVGAALLAGIGVGYYPDVDTAIRNIGKADYITVQPQSDNAAIYDSFYTLYKEIRRALQPIYQ